MSRIWNDLMCISLAGRTTRFDTIPSPVASKVVVRKAVTPDLPSDAVADNVDILTRGAFDYPGRRIAADVGLGFCEPGGGRQYDATTHVSDRFFNDTFGIILSASRFEDDMMTDNFAAAGKSRPSECGAGQVTARKQGYQDGERLHRVVLHILPDRRWCIGGEFPGLAAFRADPSLKPNRRQGAGDPLPIG